MPFWVILVVAGVLVVAALVLIIAVHILDVHAEQQCAHLHDLTQRSLQQKTQNQQDHKTQFQFRCGESQQQLCCVCGSVRNRRPQQHGNSNGINSSSSNSRAKGLSSSSNNPRLSTASGLLQPLMDVAYGKKSSLSSVGPLECLSGLTSSSRRKGMSGLQGGWFNGRRFFRGNNTGTEESQGKVRVECSQAPVSVSVAAAAACTSSSSSASTAAFSSASRTVGGTGSGSMTTITATITTTNSPSSSSPSPLSTRVQTSSGNGGTEGGASWKPIPQRRLVLEILMSPGAGDGQGGALPRATGVRLKLETNASLESLASLAAAASSGVENALQSQEADPEALASALTAGFTSPSSGRFPTYELSTCNVSSLSENNGTSSRDSNSSIEEGDTEDVGLTALSTVVGHRCDLMSQEAPCTIGGEDDSGSSAGQAICTIPLDNRSVNFGSPSATSPNSVSAVASKIKSNGHITGVNSSAKAKAKVGSCSTNSNLCAISALPGCGVSTSTPLKGAPNQGNSSSTDGLGSLRICILDGSAKGKSMKDSSKGVTAEIASALAALNVESIGGKGVGMGLTIGSGISSDTSGRSTLSEKVDVVQEEEVPGDGSGSEQVVEDGDEHHPVPEAAEEDESDANKKEKRKKKNRGRRQKAKAAAAAVAAAAACIEAQERLGKHCIEAAETKAATECEVGCICGTPKGACHSSGCPYPFTSSGSNVQRKIKEQYDELVRSNVAKTLTLAQVGRFTTCLVEAKSALQQKSESIQRKFTIAKSLLSKADKSSFDRLCGQIYGLEIEQKKLEEDTVVYNRLQEQLKLSPAYQKMLEYGRTHFELQPNTGQLIEKLDSEDIEISFEELLAQEKKDSFWQKHGPSRSSSTHVS